MRDGGSHGAAVKCDLASCLVPGVMESVGATFLGGRQASGCVFEVAVSPAVKWAANYGQPEAWRQPGLAAITPRHYGASTQSSCAYCVTQPLTKYSVCQASHRASICSNELDTQISRSSGVLRFGLKSVTMSA